MSAQKGPEGIDETQSRRPGTAVLLAAALLGLFAGLLDLAGRFRQPIIVDIGPSTGRYGSGFEDSEETPPTTSRWTRQNAAFDIPLSVEASSAGFSVRAARYLDDPTQITVKVGGRLIAAFEQPRGRQRIQEMAAPLPAGPLGLEFQSDDPKLGMALDWIRIDGARWRVPAREWTVWVLPVGIFVALLVSGASLAMAGGATAVILALLASVAAVDPFGFVHTMRDVAVPAILLSLLAGIVFRGHTAVVLAITTTVLLKGGFIFHPNFFYNDVRQNERYVGALRSYNGGLLERSTQAQIDLGVGYPRIIGGKKYAFPYSPIFYWPFTNLPPDRDTITRAFKHTALFGAALEVGLAVVLARKILPAAGTSAAWLTLAFPIVTSRLLYAMWPTIVAHALDLLVVLLATKVAEDPKNRRSWALFCLGVAATLLAYVSSLFTMSAFLLALALLVPGIRAATLALWVIAMFTAALGLYGRFTMTFLTQILPDLLTGPGSISGTPSDGGWPLAAAFTRIVMFGGYGYPALALAGFVVVASRRDMATAVFKAYVLAFIALVCLRGLSGGLFKDLKELEFGGPALAVLSAFALASIPPPLARRIVLWGVVAAGVWMQWGHFERWSRLVLG